MEHLMKEWDSLLQKGSTQLRDRAQLTALCRMILDPQKAGPEELIFLFLLKKYPIDSDDRSLNND